MSDTVQRYCVTFAFNDGVLLATVIVAAYDEQHAMRVASSRIDSPEAKVVKSVRLIG